MLMRVIVLSLLYQSPSSFSCLYDKLYLPACSLLVFLGFQLTDFENCFVYGYFVVSSPDERFHILLPI